MRVLGLRYWVVRPFAGLGGVHIGTHYALAAGHRLALVGRPRVGLPLPMSAIGHDGVTVHPAVDACLVHVVMVGR